MSKPNPFVKNFKNINKIINSLLEENLNKLKFENLINLLKNNKIIITFVAFVVLFLSYLLLPTLYKQNDISKKLQLDLLQKLNLNFNFKNNINYNFFPKPHFTIKDSVILNESQNIAKVSKLRVNISLDNLFSLKNINIKDVTIENANFELNVGNYNFFSDLLKNNYLNRNLNIKNSNIFFRNSKKDVLFINKIAYLKFYYDIKNLQNTLISKNELFNFPYEIKLNDDSDKKKLISIINCNLLKLKIENELDYNNEVKKGTVNIVYNKSKSNIVYKTNSKFFEFNLVDKVENPNYSYFGRLNLKPFYSSFEGETKSINLAHLFNINSFVPQLLKTGILNKENIDFELKIKANNIFNYWDLVNLNLNSKIKSGLIDVDQTKYQWKDFADFKLTDSLIFVRDGQLIIDAKLEIDIYKINEIYKYLLTPKNLRKNMKKIVLNFSHNFDQNIITFRDIRLDDEYNQYINKIMSSVILKDNKLQNKIYLKKLLNKALEYYSG